MGRGKRTKKLVTEVRNDEKKINDKYNIKIIIPGSDSPFLLKLASNNTIGDIRQSILERPDCYFRTCFAIYNEKNIRLDDTVEIGSIKYSDPIILKMIDKQYLIKDILTHYYRFYNICFLNVARCALEGFNGSSLSFCIDIAGMSLENGNDKDQNEIELYNPNIKSLNDFYPNIELNNKKLVKSLKLSTYNPPLNHKKLEGDLLYIDLITLENNYYGITAQPNGFYINKSTLSKFDNNLVEDGQRYTTLDSVVNNLSPLYRKNFIILQKLQSDKSAIEVLPAPYPIHYWLGYKFEPEEDEFKFLETCSNCSTAEETIGFSRDWNEELQSVRDLKCDNEDDLVTKHKYLIKVYSDLLNASIKTAISVVDGRISPLNNCEDEKMRMYLWSNLFIFISCENKDLYKEFGGEIAGHAAAGVDFNNTNIINLLDIPDLHMLGTCVIDYYGRRLIVQTVLPGIFHRNNENSVEYGSIDHGKIIFYDENLEKLTKELSNKLHIQPLEYIDSSHNKHNFYLSFETKGLIGTDGRKYLLDFYRMYPPDHTFLPFDTELFEKDLLHESIDFTISHEYAQQYGFVFPKNYPHRLVTYRPELIKYFNTRSPNDNQNMNYLFSAFKDIDIGLISPDCFDTKMNICSTDEKTIAHLRHNARHISSILVSAHIPNFIKRISSNIIELIDGESLCKLLHENGINIRYLGYITHLISDDSSLIFIKWLCIIEMICRSVKRILRNILSKCEKSHANWVISHFLNCFLSSHHDPSINLPSSLIDKNLSKSKRTFVNPYKISWSKLDPRTLWNCIQYNVQCTFGYNIVFTSIDELCNNICINRLAILRNICKKVAIQVMIHDYDFESKRNPTFNSSDILAINAVFKRPINPLPPDIADKFYMVKYFISSSQIIYYSKLQQDIPYLLAYFKNITGQLGEENALLNTFISKLYLGILQPRQALLFQIKATVLFERVFGVDHHMSILSYYNLGVACKGCNLIVSSINCFVRSRYLAIIAFGIFHPFVHEVDKNLAAIFYETKEYLLARLYIDNLFSYLIKYDPTNYKSLAEFHQLNAASYFGLSNYRSALSEEKLALSFYKKVYQDNNHPAITSCQSLLEIYLRKAVSHEKNVLKNPKTTSSTNTKGNFDISALD